MLGKLPVPGRPTSLDYSRARAFVLAVGAGGGCLDIFFSHLSLLFFLPFSGRRPDIDGNIVSKGGKPKTTNQPTFELFIFLCFLQLPPRLELYPSEY